MHCAFVGVHVDVLVGVLVVIMTAMNAVLLRVVTNAAICWCITLGTLFRRHLVFHEFHQQVSYPAGQRDQGPVQQQNDG